MQETIIVHARIRERPGRPANGWTEASRYGNVIWGLLPLVYYNGNNGHTVTSLSYNHVRNPRGSSGILYRRVTLSCLPSSLLPHLLFHLLSLFPLPRFSPSIFQYHCHRFHRVIPLSSSKVIRYDPAGLTWPKLEGIIWG